MRKNPASHVFNPHALVAFSLHSVSALLTMVGFRSVLLAIAIVALPSQAWGDPTWCTAPYVQVGGPDPGGNPGGLQIQSISIGEPFVSCSARSLTVVIKVNTLNPGTPPNNTVWETEFYVPRNLLSPEPDSPQIIFVSWDTRVVPTGQFNYGFVDHNLSGSQYTSQCSVGLGTCPATGTVTPDGTITINLDLTSPVGFTDIKGNHRFAMSALPAGWQLTQIQGYIWVGSGPVFVSHVPPTGVAAQDYTIQGNLSCSNPPVVNPPVAALMGNPTSGNAPLTVNFDASGSTMAAGACGTINSYIFDFGDGEKATQSTPTVSHTYSSGGTYPARVEVTNTAGLTSTNNAEVDIAVGSATPPNIQRLREDVYVTNGPVNAMVALGNTLYIGGTFSQVGAATGSGVPIDSTSGMPVAGFPKVVGSVSAVAADGSGGWFIGGNFTSVGGKPRLNLAHIKADNTVLDWSPNADNAVYALVVSGSTVYVGGAFTNVGGLARNNIAALDAMGAATGWNPNADGTVYALAVNGSTIYAGGAFTNIGGQLRNRIAALDASGQASLVWNPNATGGTATVSALAVSNGIVYAGGAFTNIGGQLRNRIAALDASSGQASLVWNPNATGGTATVSALAVSNGIVYVGGAFSNIGGQPRNHIAALDVATGLANRSWDPNANGSVVLTLAVSGTTVYAGGDFTNIGTQLRNYIAALDATGAATAWNPKMNNSVNAVAINGSIVYAGGSFTSVGGQDRNNLAALDTITGMPTSWNPSANSAVFAMAADSSTVYVGGNFASGSGQPSIGGQPRNHIAALDPTNGAATAWDANANDLVWALAVNGSTIYAGGWFTNIGGQPRNRIAALDTTSAVATPWDPNADGVNTPGFALTVSGSTVYAGGSFANIGGQPRNHIAALDATTGLATGWNPNPAGEIAALVVNGSTVFAAGVFSNIGGQTRNDIAALDAASGLATPWNADANFRVTSLAVSGSTLYTGGYFTSIGGQPRNRIAALDLASGAVAPWNPNVDPNLLPPFFFPSVNALAVTGGTVYAGGNFTSVSGLPQSYIAGIEALFPVQLVSVVSRKTHGGAGTFDVDLPLTGPRGVECRNVGALPGGATGDYQLVFTFSNDLKSVASASVTAHNPTGATGTADSPIVGPNVGLGLGANQCEVNLTNVSNAQYITVTLNSVLDVTGASGNVLSPQMGVLIGDVTGNGVVTNTDVSVVKGQVNPTTPVTQGNCREDVTVNGFVTNTDVSVVKGQVNPTGGLPPPP